MTNHESHEYEERRQLGAGIVAVSTMRRPQSDAKQLRIKRLTPDAVLPTKESDTDSGYDIFAAEDVLIAPGETKVISTGIAIQLPAGYEATVRPRSGITSKTSLRVQVGTIDESYRKEIGIIVDNTYRAGRNPRPFMYDVRGKGVKIATSQIDEGTYEIKRGDKLAQLVLSKRPDVIAIEVGELEDTERGGFGSTGYTKEDAK